MHNENSICSYRIKRTPVYLIDHDPFNMFLKNRIVNSFIAIIVTVMNLNCLTLSDMELWNLVGKIL